MVVVQKHQFFGVQASLWSCPTLTSVHDCWKNHSFDYIDLCPNTNIPQKREEVLSNSQRIEKRVITCEQDKRRSFISYFHCHHKEATESLKVPECRLMSHSKATCRLQKNPTVKNLLMKLRHTAWYDSCANYTFGS